MDAIHSEVIFRSIYKSQHNVSTLTCSNSKLCYKNKLHEVFVGL